MSILTIKSLTHIFDDKVLFDSADLTVNLQSCRHLEQLMKAALEITHHRERAVYIRVLVEVTYADIVLDFYSLQARIKKVAGGLGVHNFGYDTQIGKLSGGQRAKLMLPLARVLRKLPGEYLHECRLACAVESHDADVLAVIDGEVIYPTYKARRAILLYLFIRLLRF